MVAGWPDLLADDPTDWLLEEENPSVRYHTLRALMELPEDDRQVVAAKQAIMEKGPVPVILAAQDEEGYWVKPGSGYSPKYQGSVWQLHFPRALRAGWARRADRARLRVRSEPQHRQQRGFLPLR